MVGGTDAHVKDIDFYSFGVVTNDESVRLNCILA